MLWFLLGIACGAVITLGVVIVVFVRAASKITW